MTTVAADCGTILRSGGGATSCLGDSSTAAVVVVTILPTSSGVVGAADIGLEGKRRFVDDEESWDDRVEQGVPGWYLM